MEVWSRLRTRADGTSWSNITFEIFLRKVNFSSSRNFLEGSTFLIMPFVLVQFIDFKTRSIVMEFTWVWGNFRKFGPFEILVTPVFLFFCYYHKFTKIFEWRIHHFKYTTSTKFEFTKFMSPTVTFLNKNRSDFSWVHFVLSVSVSI